MAAASECPFFRNFSILSAISPLGFVSSGIPRPISFVFLRAPSWLIIFQLTVFSRLRGAAADSAVRAPIGMHFVRDLVKSAVLNKAA